MVISHPYAKTAAPQKTMSHFDCHVGGCSALTQIQKDVTVMPIKPARKCDRRMRAAYHG